MKIYIIFAAFLVMAPPAAVAESFGKRAVGKTENKPYQEVVFDHDRHRFRESLSDCNTCHHTGGMDQSCSSAGCHPGRNGTRTFHAMCIGCHQERMQQAPLTCIGCHKKK